MVKEGRTRGREGVVEYRDHWSYVRWVEKDSRILK